MELSHDPATWFTEFQLQSVIRNGSIPDWFHGIITRKTSEELLGSKPPGYFMIRVSESRIGYTLSYRAEDRCRHFMIDVLGNGRYVIVGENRTHASLHELVYFHRRFPIMPFTQVLTSPCGQISKSQTDYAELLFPKTCPNSAQTFSSPNPAEPELPPALPYRPNNLTEPNMGPPQNQNWPGGRLYPCLEQMTQHVSPPALPWTRKLPPAPNPPSKQPSEAPANSGAQRQHQAYVAPASAPGPPMVSPHSNQKPAANVHLGKLPDMKPLVISNLKGLKKKFQKKTSSPVEDIYEEIGGELSEGRGENDSQYQGITGESNLEAPPLSYTDPDHSMPEEYQLPPPFAPGF